VKEAITSAAAEALVAASVPKYEVSRPDGTSDTHELYVDAKTDAVRSGGTLREVR
jgi:hypothetical protein